MSETTTRFLVVGPGGAIHNVEFDDEDSALHEAAGHDPAWGVIPVYYPETRTDEPEDVPEEKPKAPAGRRNASAKNDNSNG